MISLLYTSHTKAYNTIYTACNIVEAITPLQIGTLDDPELLKFCSISHVWKATTAKRMKIDPHCQRPNCCALKVLFNDV